MTFLEYLAGAGAFLVAYGMYLLFCWKVYKHSGDAKALDMASKVGRFRMFFLGISAPPGEASLPEGAPPARPLPPAWAAPSEADGSSPRAGSADVRRDGRERFLEVTYTNGQGDVYFKDFNSGRSWRSDRHPGPLAALDSGVEPAKNRGS